LRKDLSVDDLEPCALVCGPASVDEASALAAFCSVATGADEAGVGEYTLAAAAETGATSLAAMAQTLEARQMGSIMCAERRGCRASEKAMSPATIVRANEEGAKTPTKRPVFSEYFPGSAIQWRSRGLED
jgi:hypothetical protein